MLKAAQMDWLVGMEMVHTAKGQPIPEFFRTFRQDTDATFGIVSPKYKVVQNFEAFDFLDSLIAGGMFYEAAGTLFGGRIVWVLARMPEVDNVAEGDNQLRYVLFTTTHDGTGKIIATPTSVRVVCNNTLTMAIKGMNGFRHIGDMKAKLAQAREYISQFNSQFTTYAINGRQLVAHRVSAAEVNEFLAVLFPEVSKEGRGQTIRNNRIETIKGNLNNNIPSVKGTLWGLLQGITKMIDHQSTFKGEGQEKAENRMISIIDGNGAQTKAEAYALALKFAGIK
jgi:phage/plasmid-like protein (TIGR03299 family)